MAGPSDALRRPRAAWGRSSLWVRLAAVLVLLLAGVTAAVFVVLFATGVFAAGRDRVEAYVAAELATAADDVARDFGALAAGGTALSRALSVRLDQVLADHDLAAAELADHPEVVDTLLQAAFDLVLNSLKVHQASGAFVVLDATANPGRPGAESLRAGLFLRSTEPNVANRTDPSISYLRGPVDLARRNGLLVLAQWRPEFEIEPGDFYSTALAGADAGLDVSRLYVWQPKAKLPGDFSGAMLVAVPLLARDGHRLGVCGLEMNEMLFKLLFAPDNSTFPGALVALAPVRGDGAVAVDSSLLAGRRYLSDPETRLEPAPRAGRLDAWRGEAGYVGRTQTVSLYPRDAVHAGVRWQVAALIPDDEYEAYTSRRNQAVGWLLAGAAAVALGAGVVAIRRLLRPLKRAVAEAEAGGAVSPTNIREIDDLFAFLAAQDKAAAARAETPAPVITDEEFARRLATLTRAERAVFDQYVEGYDAREVAARLFLSINTIKTHNKRIYQKLGVASRRELLAHLRASRGA